MQDRRGLGCEGGECEVVGVAVLCFYYEGIRHAAALTPPKRLVPIRDAIEIAILGLHVAFTVRAWAA